MDQRGQVSVGGGNDPGVGGDGSDTSQWFVAPLLEHAQQFHLQGGTHLTDFIEKNRSLGGQGKTSGLVRAGIGEGARLVAEQLGFEQRLGQGRAVDRDKRSPAARTQGMDGTRHHLLAGTGRTKDEHRARTGGDGRQHLEQPLHERTAADQVADPTLPVQLLAQRLDLGEVAEDLGSTDHLAVAVPEHRGGKADGNTVTVRIDEPAGSADDRPTCAQGLAQGAGFAAHVGAQQLGTEPADGLVPVHAGNLLGCTVERGDPPLLVHGKDAVRDTLENGFGGCADFFWYGWMSGHERRPGSSARFWWRDAFQKPAGRYGTADNRRVHHWSSERLPLSWRTGQNGVPNNTEPPPARRREGVRWEWPGRPGRPAGSEIVAQRLTVTLVCSLFTYLKNTGKATKKATQIRYSTPLMWE